MNRIITFGLAGLMVLVAAMGWLLGVSPLLDQANTADDQRSSVQMLNDINEAKVVELKAKFEKLDELSAQVASMRLSVPDRLDIPAFLREINGYGAANGVTLVSVAVDTAQEYAPPAAPAAPAAPDAGATPAPADAAATAPTAPSGPTLVRVPVQITVAGDYAAVMAFGGSLQTGQRLFLATSFNVAQTPEGFSGVMAGFVYALPVAGTGTPAAGADQGTQEAAGAAPQG